MRAIKLMVLASAVFATSCVSTTYRDSVAEFGEASKVAVDLQSTNLKAIAEAEDAALKQQLAEDRVDILLPGSCIPAVDSPTPDNSATVACALRLGDGGSLPKGTPLPSGPKLRIF